MNKFSNKKALCFIALPHHNRFLVPIMEALARQGMQIVYFTAAAEGAFEITLNDANLPYRHAVDYATDETSQKAAAAMRELRPILQEKILASQTLQSVPLVIQDKVIRSAVENLYSFDKMLEIEQPDLLFALHELNPWGKILGYLSHVHGIPYFTLQEGLYYADVHYYRFHTDYSTACLVWGEECREILLKAGCSDDKIFPVGNTHIWSAKKEFTDPAVVLRTRSALGIGAENKVVLFLMSHSHYRPFEPQIFLRWMKSRGDVVAVFKWHPVTGKEIVDRALQNVKETSSVINVHDFDTYGLIGASDVCITVGNSTTGLEALCFGKPLIEVRLPDQTYSYALQGVAEQAMGFEDIGPKCQTILAQGLTAERLEKVTQYLERNFTYDDDLAIGRIVRLVDESLTARASLNNTAALSARAETSFPCSIVLPVGDGPWESLLDTLAAVSAHTAAELYEVLIVDCSVRKETKEILASLAGDVKIIPGIRDWTYAQACNRAAVEALGKYVFFLSPGFVPGVGWLEGLLSVAEREGNLVGGMVTNENGLLWHIGVAFDVNQAPFSIYRLLPPEFSGASKRREFRAVQFPFLVSREVFLRLGGFDTALANRFDDIDFCLRANQAGFSTLYTPECRIVRQHASWEPTAEQQEMNRIRFYSKWTGHLWQDDDVYLRQDGLSHDALSALYRDLAARLTFGAKELDRGLADADR